MDFEWKQRVIFTFVLAVPLLTLGNPPPVPLPPPITQQNGIRWSKNPEKVRILQEFQAARQRVEVQHEDELELPVCTTAYADEVIQKSFDARKVWKSCPSLWEIRDAGHCNSWAAAVASVLSDRFCIASNGSIQFRVSDQHLLNCASDSMEIIDSPCPYEHLPTVWDYISKNGVVSGGYLNSQMGCQPSIIEPCYGNSSINCTNSRPPPPDSLICKKTCDNPTYGLSYQEDKKEIMDVCRLPDDNDNSVARIQHEIQTNGPVLAVMHLYSELRQYNKSVGSGIYQNEREAYERHQMHPVKIVGWSSKKNESYWIVANSWGYSWGDGGFFRVKMSQERPKWGAFITKNSISCPTPNVMAAGDQLQQSSILQNILRLLQLS